MVTRHLLALGRCLVLLVLAVAGLVMAVLNIVATVLTAVGLVPVHLAALAAARKLATRCRRLAYDWGGVQIPEPYQPEPGSPHRRPDGLYEYDNKLYRSPRIPAMLLRMRWAGQDPATARDFTWMFVNPFVGGVLAALSPALVGFGALGLIVPRAWPSMMGTAVMPTTVVAAAAVVIGLAAGPALLRLHARWTRVLLRPATGPCIPPWVGSRALSIWHCLALLMLSVAGLAVFAFHLVAFLVAWGDGQTELMVFGRRLTNTYRRLAGDWAGVEIAEPYLPKPAPPERGPDGKYRYGRSLHTDPRAVVRAQGVGWVLKDHATWRDLAWVLTAAIVGVLLVVPVVLAVFGFFGLIWQPLWWPLWGPVVWLFTGAWVDPWRLWEPIVMLFPALDAAPAAVSPAIGIAMVVLGVLLAPPTLRLHAGWSRLLLAPTESARLAQRVHRLTETRTDATNAEAAELRRIERDLHDGAQARLVSMGMKLSAIEQLMDADPAAAKALLAQVREGSSEALTELRDLVRGIHPPVLSERGLGDAVRALALDTALTVDVAVDLPGRLKAPVESAAYFAVSELLTNAVRHAGAEHASIDLRHDDTTLHITVTDNGRGGVMMPSASAPAPRPGPGGDSGAVGGSGLRGIERRLGTFDGVLTLHSPQGGPTTITMEIPCTPSSPRTSTSSGKD